MDRKEKIHYNGGKKEAWRATREDLVTLTKEGEQLKKKAVAVPDETQGCIPLEKDELIQLKICLTRR